MTVPTLKIEPEDSAYVIKAKEKQARNMQRLKDLGLWKNPVSRKKPAVKGQKRGSRSSTLAARKSARVRQEPAVYAAGLPEDLLDRETSSKFRLKRATMKSKRGVVSRWNKPSSSQYSLTNVGSASSTMAATAFASGANQRSGLETRKWLIQVEKYLRDVEKLSASNQDRVMGQIQKLALHSGIGYFRWPKGVVFSCPCGKSLMDCDFEQLFEQAQAHEEKYGRDGGNGWLLRHPISKLINFRQWEKEKEGKKETK